MNDITRISSGKIPAATQTRRERIDEIETSTHRFSRRSPRAQFNFIPSNEQLKKLVDDALSALSRGIYWDRGSIVDIVL